MPICPRCGKCLSSDQALTYHLNRKYRCGTWKCTKCNDIFNTKFHLQMHELSCIKVEDNTPMVDYLLTLYKSLPNVIVSVDKENLVSNCTPNVEKILNIKFNDIKNKDLHEILTRYNLKCNVLNEGNNETILMLDNT